MTRHAPDPPKPDAEFNGETTLCLTWRVHLLRRYPQRLTGLLLILLIAALCVWLLFHNILPVLAALLLLIGTASDYLFPLSYRITAEGVYADGLTSRLVLRWKEARRGLLDNRSVTLTPLAAPSRLDEFRGVMLRFAPDGEPGDRASVLAAIAHYAPALLPIPEAAQTTPRPLPEGKGEH